MPAGSAAWPAADRLLRWSRADAGHLARVSGLPRRAGQRLAAAFELGRRMEALACGPRPSLHSASAVQRLLGPEVRGLDRETFWCLLLDGRHRLLRLEVVSIGTLTCSLVHPREVFGPALERGAAAVIVAHNHPSGDPTPSEEDREVTRRLAAVGDLVGIPLVDHVVLGAGAFRSLRDEPCWPAVRKS